MEILYSKVLQIQCGQIKKECKDGVISDEVFDYAFRFLYGISEFKGYKIPYDIGEEDNVLHIDWYGSLSFNCTFEKNVVNVEIFENFRDNGVHKTFSFNYGENTVKELVKTFAKYIENM